MPKEIISTEQAPKPAGAYSQGVRWDQIVFVSGQVGVDPSTGQPVSEDVREQTRQVLKNLSAVLDAAGSNLDSVVKTTCFLTDIANFGAFNEIYREFFASDPPARSTVQAGLVPPWLVEVEATAIRP